MESPSTGDMRLITGLCHGPASIDPLDWPAHCGGEAVFIGRTRAESHVEFGPLLRLEYEAYEPMVKAVLDQLARDAAERFVCGAVRVVHAVGPVAPGEASVVIQVAAPHRPEAFEACRWLIDHVKQAAPIWKRQVFERGEVFVEGEAARMPQSKT